MANPLIGWNTSATKNTAADLRFNLLPNFKLRHYPLQRHIEPPFGIMSQYLLCDL
jgi:hypothetical protein